MTTLLDHVPAAISRVQREIVLARFLGKLAVDQGIRELRQRLEGVVVPTDALRVEQPADPVIESVEKLDVNVLPLADYDHLPASDIVSMLAGLEPAERDAIEAYELQGRHRRTILGKLDQLRET
jgi:hypothetical protein